MSCETLIVAQDDADRAFDAAGAIRRLGVPPNDIRRHSVRGEMIVEMAAAR